MNNLPIVILVHPQMGENIGAVARAMSNFGLKELRLVAPRDGWPNPKAREMASGAENIIEAAKIYPDFPLALSDIQVAYATTARPRDMEKRVVTPDAAVSEIAGGAQKAALVFGPERTGLTNEDITLCDALITIPTAPENWSLNIAQSSVVVFYEWWRANATALPSHEITDAAPKGEWLGLFEQLENYLDQSDYFRVPHKKPIMWQNLQNMLMRAKLTSQEVRTLRGMLRSLWERKRG